MKEPVKNAYSWLHSALVNGVRRLPVSTRTFGPAKGIVTDVRAWVEAYAKAHPESPCEYQIIKPAGESQRQSPRTLEDVPVFVQEQKVHHPELFVASIPQARVVAQTGVIVSPDDQVFEQSCCWKSHFLTRDLEFNSLRRTLSPQELPGTFITLLSRHSGSFYHWFTECLLRLSLLESTPSSTPILVHHDLRDWQRDTLRLLGISDERIVPLANGCYEVDQLYFPSFLAYASFTQDWTFSWADWSLRWLRAKFCGTRTANPEKRIYISRQGAAHRQVLNEDHVMRRLQGDGFQIVEANPLSLREKIELFGDASIILSAHGAGLTHVLFAPAGARVIEALDPYHLMGGLYYQMAASLRQEYWYLFAENQAWQSRRPSREPNQQWPFKGAVNPKTGARKGYDNLTIPVDLMMRTVAAAQGRAANT